MPRPIEAYGNNEEQKRETLACEDENQQVSAHCPGVIDEACTFVAAATGLLPRHTGLVDQKSKQDWSWYHSYTEIHQSTGQQSIKMTQVLVTSQLLVSGAAAN